MQHQTSSTTATPTTTPKSVTPSHGQGGIALAPHSEHLVRMRAKGKSNGEILSWLHTQGVSSTLAEIAAFWQHRAAQQEDRQQHQKPEPQNQPQPPPPPAPPRTAPQDGPSGSAPAGVTNLHRLMEKYQQVLEKQIDKVNAEPNPNPENVKLIDRMMRTVMVYNHAQEQKQERKEALELKKADQEQKAQKAATAAESLAKAESGVAQSFPKDFDNTEFIKVTRDEYFKDANTPAMKALVEKMLMEADAQAIAAGMKIVPYVPTGPLPPKPSG